MFSSVSSEYWMNAVSIKRVVFLLKWRTFVSVSQPAFPSRSTTSGISKTKYCVCNLNILNGDLLDDSHYFTLSNAFERDYFRKICFLLCSNTSKRIKIIKGHLNMQWGVYTSIQMPDSYKVCASSVTCAVRIWLAHGHTSGAREQVSVKFYHAVQIVTCFSVTTVVLIWNIFRMQFIKKTLNMWIQGILWLPRSIARWHL